MANNQSNSGLDQCHNCGVRRKQVANPTTNYGFVLPTPTDLVTDLPADFDVALQGVDTQLKALQPGTTLGDLAYSSASANTNTVLAIGSTNDVLTVAGGVPTWAAPAGGGGKILQMVTGTYSTNFTTSSTSPVDTGLSVTITPTLATSTIAIWHNGNYFMNSGATSAINIRILRGASAVKTYNSQMYDNNSDLMRGEISMIYVDSPATTSATTYKIQIWNDIANTIGAQYNNEESRFILMEVGV
jgi:hypothetical protein